MAGDDSLGLEIIKRLEARGGCPCPLRSLAHPLALMEILETAGAVLLVDAVSSHMPPGSLHWVPLSSSEIEIRTLASLSSHGWGFAQTLELANALGRRIPRLVILGIEIGTVGVGEPRSPAVEQTMEMVLERFPRLLSLLSNPASPLWKTPNHLPPGDTSFLSQH